MADLVNEFSWSRTRDNVFQECRRRYYYQYYGAWGGWDADADPLVRRLYILKQLAHPPDVGGPARPRGGRALRCWPCATATA